MTYSDFQKKDENLTQYTKIYCDLDPVTFLADPLSYILFVSAIHIHWSFPYCQTPVSNYLCICCFFQYRMLLPPQFFKPG